MHAWYFSRWIQGWNHQWWWTKLSFPTRFLHPIFVMWLSNHSKSILACTVSSFDRSIEPKSIGQQMSLEKENNDCNHYHSGTFVQMTIVCIESNKTHGYCIWSLIIHMFVHYWLCISSFFVFFYIIRNRSFDLLTTKEKNTTTSNPQYFT